jgi:hypothetical protein
LNTDDPQQPLALLLETQNLLGVAASEPDRKLLSEFEIAGQKFRGSNSGKKYVQLIAPGRDIYSLAVVESSGTGKVYGYVKASGTSQAVPQVAATAAMMKAQHRYDGIDGGVRIKARLIYTSDWYSHYAGKVWGGFLNSERATFYPERDLFWTTPSVSSLTAKTIYPSNGSTTWVNITNVSTGAYIDDPNSTTNAGGAPPRIRFDRILRLFHLGNQQYRVIYIGDDNRVRILMDAELDGSIQYKKMDSFDGIKFKTTTFPKIQTLTINQLTDYISSISKMDQGIRFSSIGAP